MIVKEKIGNIHSLPGLTREIDWLQLEWHELPKRIMHKRSLAGVDLSIKFMSEAQQLTQGDILFEDDTTIIAVDILATNVIVIEPVSMYEIASVCYEIGNKHLPLFYEQNILLIPFDLPLFKLLTAQGYQVKQEERKLLQPLKTTVSPHETGNNNETIFSKIMRMTATSGLSKKEI